MKIQVLSGIAGKCSPRESGFLLQEKQDPKYHPYQIWVYHHPQKTIVQLLVKLPTLSTETKIQYYCIKSQFGSSWIIRHAIIHRKKIHTHTAWPIPIPDLLPLASVYFYIPTNHGPLYPWTKQMTQNRRYQLRWIYLAKIIKITFRKPCKSTS